MFLYVIVVVFFCGCDQVKTEVSVGKIKLITQKTISKDFAYCTAVIAQFGDSAIFAHATPDQLANEVSLPLIWNGKIYSEADDLVTSTTVIQRVIMMSDSLGVNRDSLSWYIIAGCYEKGMEEILPSINHYNLKITQLTVDNTFRESGRYRDITFNPATRALVVKVK